VEEQERDDSYEDDNGDFNDMIVGDKYDLTDGSKKRNFKNMNDDMDMDDLGKSLSFFDMNYDNEAQNFKSNRTTKRNSSNRNEDDGEF